MNSFNAFILFGKVYTRPLAFEMIDPKGDGGK